MNQKELDNKNIWDIDEYPKISAEVQGTLDETKDIHRTLLSKSQSRRSFSRWLLLGAMSVPLLQYGIYIWVKFYFKHNKSEEIVKNLPKMKQYMHWYLINSWLPHEKIDDILHSLVILQTDWAYGTWFFIDDKIILTAGHVISHINPDTPGDYSQVGDIYGVYDLDGNIYTPRLVYGDSENDLGGIIVETRGQKSLDVLHNTPESGIRITAWFWWELPHVTSWEEVSHFSNKDLAVVDWNTNKIPDGEEMWLSSNYVIGGDSGGPVMDKNGEVVWVMVNRIRIREQIIDTSAKVFTGDVYYAWHEPLNDIRSFLLRMQQHVDSL